ncbi:MAG: branched-chain amino acid ABC transporter permease [Magnetospirillum sp. WYHS-4]
MDASFVLIQALNGVQYGILLFLVASGLTLVFGIMGVINLAHGSFYMIGAYLAYWLTAKTGSLGGAVALGIPIAFALGLAVERFAVSFLYGQDHLKQVLLTYGLILVLNELQRMLWGSDVHSVPVPEILRGTVRLTETLSYPIYRLFLSAACLALAGGMAWVVRRTRLGMTIRAAAADRETAGALGIDTDRLFSLVFGAGAVLAALAGMLAAPIESVAPGMGEQVLVLCLVIVVIGGIGSVKGAFLGAMAIGLADSFGKTLLPETAGLFVYGLMAAALVWRPQGLFARGT